MKTLAITITILVAAILLFVVVSFNASDEIVLRARESVQLNSLSQTYNALKKHQTVDEWDVGVYVSADAINDLLSAYHGLVIEQNDDSTAARTILTVKDAAIISFDVMPLVKITIEAKSKNSNAVGRLDVKAMLVYRGSYSEPLSDDQNLNFGIRIISVAPSIKTGWLALEASDKWSEYFGISVDGIASLLDCSLLDVLTDSTNGSIVNHCKSFLASNDGGPFGFPLTIPKALDIDIGVDEIEEQVFEQGDKKGKAVFSKKLPAKTRSYPLEVKSPIFTRDGIWVLGDIKNLDLDTMDVSGASENHKHSHEVLLTYINKNISRIRAGNDDIEFFIKSEPLLKAINNIDKYSDDELTYTMSGDKTEGNYFLSYEKWKDQNLGDGGIFLRYSDVHPYAKAQARFYNINGIWDKTSGIKINLKTNVDAEAKLHAHIDPLIGGGFGVDMTLLADTQTENLSAQYYLNKTAVSGTDVVLTNFSLQCKQIKVYVRTQENDPIKYSGLRIPSVGAYTYEYIGNKGQHPEKLLHGLPEYEDIYVDSNAYRQISENKTRAIKYVDMNVKSKPFGYVVTAGVDVQTLNIDLLNEEGKVFKQKADEKRNNLIAAINKIELSENCPAPKEIEIVLGAVNFGTPTQVKDFIIASGLGGANLLLLSPEVQKLVKDTLAAIEKEAKQIERRTKEGKLGWEDTIPGVTTLKGICGLFGC